MALETSNNAMYALLENLNLEEPWIPPRSWDSLPPYTGASSQPPPRGASHSPYSTSAVSEPSLVRLAMNALQGVESSLKSIEEISAVLRYSSADRTSHRIPSLWTRCSSTIAIGNLITSIGQFGCIVFLLRRFVDYFITPDLGGVGEFEKHGNSDSREEGKCPLHMHTLVNQAFAISVGKVLDGYVSSLNTLSASVSLRRFSKMSDGGCLTSIGHMESTLLEVYLHTAGLRTQIEALGNICNVNDATVSFPLSSLEDMKTKANSEFGAFPRSGDLLSFLYSQLKVADPDHCALLKFLFLQSYEPYSDFIRSWIYDGSISDPYHEFVVEYVDELSVDASNATEIASDSALPTIRVRNGVAVPCFLEECLVPLCRTGQQLQVIMKLLELCNNVGVCDIHEEILPCLVGLSREYHWFAFPLTFAKETIKTMVHVRATYYKQMMEKIENILSKFDFRSRQVASQNMSSRIVNNLEKNLDHQASSVAQESQIPPLTDRRNQHLHENTANSELSSDMDEYSYTEDLLDSSECTSSEISEDQNEAEQLFCASQCMRPNYLSALDFSPSLSTDNIITTLHQNVVSCSADDVPSKINQKFCYSAHPSDEAKYLVDSENKLLRTFETWNNSSEDKSCLSDGQHIGRRKDNTWLHLPNCEVELGNCGLQDTDLEIPENTSTVNARNKDVDQHVIRTSRNIDPHFWKLKYDSNFLSMNPTLNRGHFFNVRTMSGERHHANYMGSNFDFNDVRSPLKQYAVKLPGHHGSKLGTECSFITEAPAVRIDTDNLLVIEDYNDIVKENIAKSCNVGSDPYMKGNDDEHLLPNVSGGSAWESMLGRSDNLVNRSTRDHRTRLMGGIEMPLDFVIKRCLVDEVLLQYTYISKLTIKLLIEGFKLQEHLQALRCYHFMELADWADLFIMSLWHRKWLVNEVGKRIPEIQAVLELSLQRSSCEGDPNKDRLYTYLKGDHNTHISAPAKGIHSFEFLGLGYRVDWPVSIILTPAALKLYSEIFNFLIKVKLAAFSLSDAWCSLKCYRSEQHKGELQQVSVLNETRHKINHFVSTLQQYVQSQLSHVSWYRFLHSLKHKVKDMLDLESVHMAYLTESLNICFLSNETRSVAGIIQNILQCAMDFRSCLTGIILRAGSSDEKLTNIFSQTDISQVHSIRKAFSKNLKELYLIYLQSPKHGEFSISRFWDYLNYNDYYAGIINKQMGHRIFPS